MLGNVFFLTFVAWPAVLLLSSLMNMLIWGKFHWAEPFILAPIAGMIIGVCAWWGLQSPTNGAVRFFRGLCVIMSHGFFGILRLCGLLSDPTKFFWWSAISTVAATLSAAALDHAASAIGPSGGAAIGLAIPLFFMKAPFCLVSTGIGLLIFLVGAIHAATSAKESAGFAGGVTWEEWANDGPNDYFATTVGATFHCWKGPVAKVFDHERYHTRQCIYFHDWMIPMWVVSFICTGGQSQQINPMETVAYEIQGSAPAAPAPGPGPGPAPKGPPKPKPKP